MASTGLLGINPYQKGVAIDISSKPTQMLIQLQQKEQAKNEALDKYFMDYDKNITPAGMRNIDVNGLMRRKNELKQFYFQNKEAIKRPELDNGKAYSQFTSMGQDQLGFVSKSKEQTAKAKVLSSAISDARKKNLIVEDEVGRAVSLNELDLDDPRRVDFDMANFKAYKPHDVYEFQKELKSLNTIPGKPELIKEGNYQYSRTPMEADVNNIKSFAYNKLNDTGYTKMLEHLSDEELNRLDQVYQQKTKMKLPKNDIKEISLAYTLTNLPKDYTQTNLVATPEYSSSLIASRKDVPSGQVPQGNILDSIGGDGTPVSLGKDKFGNQYKIEYGQVLGKDDQPFTGVSDIKGTDLPAELFSILAKSGTKLYAADNFKIRSEDGIITEIASPRGKVTRGFIENAQLTADKEPVKGQRLVYGKPVKPIPASKKAGAGINWKK